LIYEQARPIQLAVGEAVTIAPLSNPTFGTSVAAVVRPCQFRPRSMDAVLDQMQIPNPTERSHLVSVL
jgi:hypothetical protein